MVGEKERRGMVVSIVHTCCVWATKVTTVVARRKKYLKASDISSLKKYNPGNIRKLGIFGNGRGR